MVQSPSREANRFAASQEIPHISRNPKVHYRTHKRPPPVTILGQPNPVHIPTSHLLEIHPNIIHPSTPRSSQWSLSILFPHREPKNLLLSSILNWIFTPPPKKINFMNSNFIVMCPTQLHYLRGLFLQIILRVPKKR